MRTEKALKNQPKYKVNPFLKEQPAPIREQLEKIANTDNPDVVLARVLKRDIGSYVKIYITLDFLERMNKVTIKMFNYLVSRVKYNQDYVIIYIEDFCKVKKYKNQTEVYKAINTLIEMGIIARHASTHLYFINPFVLYKGERHKINIEL